MKKNKGFTLIELTIVMGIFIVIGTIIVSVLSATFTGNTKIRTTGELSQNGNYALSIITNLLLSSQRFEGIVVTTSPPCTPTDSTTCCTPTGVSGKSISFVGLDGGTTTLTCEDTGSTPTYVISSASASLSIPLIDATQARLSDAGTCSFTCTQVDEYSPPRIDISFSLQNIGDGSSANFRTSVSLRNQNLK